MVAFHQGRMIAALGVPGSTIKSRGTIRPVRMREKPSTVQRTMDAEIVSNELLGLYDQNPGGMNFEAVIAARRILGKP